MAITAAFHVKKDAAHVFFLSIASSNAIDSTETCVEVNNTQTGQLSSTCWGNCSELFPGTNQVSQDNSGYAIGFCRNVGGLDNLKCSL